MSGTHASDQLIERYAAGGQALSAEQEWTLEAHLEAIHPSDRERVLAEMRQSVSTAQPFAARYRMLGPDGTTSWLESRADVAPGTTPGTVAGLRGICQVIDPTDPATRSIEEAAQ